MRVRKPMAGENVLTRQKMPCCWQSTSSLRAAKEALQAGASVLVHDTTYTDDEYDSHRGWGHSTYQDAVALAMDSGVATLVLFHHEPERTDDQVDQCVALCQSLVRSRGGGRCR